MNEMIQRVLEQGYITQKEKNLITQTLSDVRDCLMDVNDLKVEG